MIKWKNANWLFASSVFTAAYLIFIVVWIGPHEIIAFSETDELNAIGDFLAGIFSPLAFIWLVAAVLTQRQELTDTRDQFAKNQEVVDAQLKTINEQSVLLQRQHTLAEETAKKTYRLNLFEQRFEIYLDLVNLHKTMSREEGFQRHDLTQLQHISARCGFVFSSVIESHFDELENSLKEFLDNQEEWETTWSRDVFNAPRKPDTLVSTDIEKTQNKQRDAILEILHPISLQNLMRSSMRVSDD